MFDEIRKIIEKEFYDNWTATPVAYDNVETTTSSDWIRVTITPIVSKNSSFQCIRHDGLITVQVFTALNKGSGAAWTLADQVATLLKNRRFSNGLRTYASSPKRIGQDIDFYQVNVVTRYEIFELE